MASLAKTTMPLLLLTVWCFLISVCGGEVSNESSFMRRSPPFKPPIHKPPTLKPPTHKPPTLKPPTHKPPTPKPPTPKTPVKTPVHPPPKTPVKTPVHPPTKAPVKKPVHPPTKAPVKKPVHPPTKAPVKTPANPPTKAPVKTPVHPPTQAPVKKPDNPPTKAPVKTPVNPPTQAPVKKPVNPPTKAPVKTPVNPPTKAPVKTPVNPPTKSPVHHSDRSAVAVQGVVYCKSCKYPGVDTLLDASTISGATLKLQCHNTKHHINVETKTNDKGYFYLQAPKTVSSNGAHKCRVFLVSSPNTACSKITNLNGGLIGGKLKLDKRYVVNNSPINVYHVGPFAFEPTCPR